MRDSVIISTFWDKYGTAWTGLNFSSFAIQKFKLSYNLHQKMFKRFNFPNIWLICHIWVSVWVDFINARNINYIGINYGISIAYCSIIRHSATPELEIPICKLRIPILVLKIILFYLKNCQYIKFSLNLLFTKNIHFIISP